MLSTVANLPFLRRFRPLAYTMVLLAIAALAYSESNAPLFFLGTLGTLVSWFLVERPRGAPLPRAMINLGVLAASSGLFYELVLANRDEMDRPHPNLLLALGHFMVAILLCKLFERKANRDYAQILTLTLLIMVAGAIIATTSLLFAILLATYLALGLYAILLFHLRTETERAMAAHPGPLQVPVTAADSLAIKRDIRLVAMGSSAMLAAIALAVFLLFPRASAQDMLSSWAGASVSTGFTDQVRMRDGVHLHESDAIVMEVKLEQNGANMGSESLQPYFRGLVLETYDSGGRKWVRSLPALNALDVDYPVTPDHPLQLVSPDRYNKLGIITQTYTLEISAGSTLFALAPPADFASDQVHSVSFSPRELIVGMRGPTPPQMHYTVESPVIVDPALYGDTKPFVTPGDLGVYRIFDFNGDHLIPSKVPQEISKLAHSLVHELLPPPGKEIEPSMARRIAERFNNYLHENYPYSLNLKAVDRSLDPTADFLLNRKDTGANCEYFASAMVMLCRAVGINARMATGYHGGEYNSLGGFYVVKQKNAHAWAEVFLPHRGWTIFDPSPASRESSAASSVARWFQEVSEVMQKAWLSTVVAFDNTSRKYLFSTISAFVEGATTRAREFFTNVTFGFRDLFMGKASPWWLKALGVGTLAWVAYLVFWLTRNWNRRRTSQVPKILRNMTRADKKSQRQLAQDLLFFDDLLRLLARAGPRKTPEETPREYIDKLSPGLGRASDDARWLITTFYAIRFGALRVTAAMRQQIDAALNRIRHELQNPAV